MMWSESVRNSNNDDDMASPSERMLRLLSLLQSHRDWGGAELAGRLEVSPRTLRRDIDRLRSLGYPVDASPGIDGGYRLAAGASMPPLVLEDDEAVALVVALRASSRFALSGTAEASVDTLAKVIQVLPPRLRRRAEDVARMTQTADWSESTTTVDPGVLATIATVARNSERLEFSYRDRTGTEEDRHVEPIRLVMLGRHWYLVAYDLMRHDWRTFRVDRVHTPHSTGAQFRPRPVPTGDAAEYVRSSIQIATTRWEIEVEAETDGDEARRRVGQRAVVTDLGPGRCRLAIPADGFEWPTMLLASLDAEFRVVSPPEFRRHLATVGRRFSRSAKSGA